MEVELIPARSRKRRRAAYACVVVVVLGLVLLPALPAVPGAAGKAQGYTPPAPYTIGLRTPAKITKLIYPTLGNPAIVKKGDALTMEFDPREGRFYPGTCPDATNFRVSVTTTNDTVNPVTKNLQVLGAIKGYSKAWPNLKKPAPPNPTDNRIWLVTVTVPYSLPEHLYDVTITANMTGYGDVTDTQTNSLDAIDDWSEPFNFVQMTDIHVFGPECDYISSNHKERTARRATWDPAVGYGAAYYHKEIQQINKLRPDFVIFSGDYIFGQKYMQKTNGSWGNVTEYEYEQMWFYQETQKLNVPVFIVIGNHDAYNYDTGSGAALNQDWQVNWTRLYGPLYYTFSYNDYKFFATNSMDWTPGQRTLVDYFGIILQPGKYMGSFEGKGDAPYTAGVDWNRAGARSGDVPKYTGQLGWLRDRLEESADARARIVTMHHDPWKTDGSGSMWASGEDPIIGEFLDMGNGNGRLAVVRLMKKYNVCLVLHGHDHSDTVSVDNTANGLRWENGQGHVIGANTTSASFQADGKSPEYPGYRRVWMQGGRVVTSGDTSFNYIEPKYSWPAYAGTNVGGTTDLHELSDPAFQSSWSAVPDNTREDVTCALTNTCNKPINGAYLEFPLKYLSGRHYYRVSNGTISNTYDVGATRMNQVRANVGAGQAKAVRVYKSAAPDTTGPDGYLLVNGGAKTTRSRSVTLTTFASDSESGVGSMMVSNRSDFRGAEWENYRSTRAWTLTEGDGLKTVYVRYRDNAMPGNVVTRSARIEFGGSTPVPPGPASTFYFAEGTCRPGFDPYICIQNPGGTDARIRITYMKGDGDTAKQDLVVRRNSRSTVKVKDVLGEADDEAHDFSAKVQCVNGGMIIAERPMYFNYQGYTRLNWDGGHDVIGATAPASTFYFAEGTCRPGFDPYICIQNPGANAADVAISFMKGDGKNVAHRMSVPKNSRSTVKVKDVLGEADDEAHDFSAKVRCVNGGKIIAERPMYFNYNGVWTGGHAVMGTTAPSKEFYFAEGTCRPGFDPYICIQNPNDAEATVVVTYMRGNGANEQQGFAVPKNSRYTVKVKDVLGEADDEAHDFSAKVRCVNGGKIIAERPMYFNYQGYTRLNWDGGHDVIGATAPVSTFYFAEGTCRPGFDPYICIQNPGASDAAVTITYMTGDGRTQSQKVKVPKHSRSTVKVSDRLGVDGDAAHDFSAKVQCVNGQKIVAERPMYFNYNGVWTGGHNVVGLPR